MLFRSEAAGGNPWELRGLELTGEPSKTSDYWTHFDEFFAQRVAKELVFSPVFSRLKSLFQDIVSRFPVFKNTNFIDTEIQGLISDNKRMLKQYGQTVYEFYQKKNNPTVSVEQVAEDIRSLSGHAVKEPSGNYGYIAPITMQDALKNPKATKDIS